jgi:hypothetical protein
MVWIKPEAYTLPLLSYCTSLWAPHFQDHQAEAPQPFKHNWTHELINIQVLCAMELQWTCCNWLLYSRKFPWSSSYDVSPSAMLTSICQEMLRWMTFTRFILLGMPWNGNTYDTHPLKMVNVSDSIQPCELNLSVLDDLVLEVLKVSFALFSSVW